MAHKLPNGLIKFDSNDYVRREHFNEQWETIDSSIGNLRAGNDHIQKEISDVIKPELKEVPEVPIVLKEGLQLVNAARDTPFKMKEIRGRTLINLLGYAGSCDNVNRYQTYQSTIVANENGIEMSAVQNSFAAFSTKDKYSFNSGACYIFLYEAKGVAGNVVGIDVPGFFSFEFPVDTEYKLYYSRLKANKSDQNIVSFFARALKAGEKYSVRNIRVYEISQADYDLLATLPSEQVAIKYPYVNGLTNVKNPYAYVTSGNLLPPFTEWEPSSAAAGNYSTNTPYELELRPKQINAFTRVGVSVLPNTVYTFSAEHSGMLAVDDGVTSLIADYTKSQFLTFNTGKHTKVYLYISNGKEAVYNCSFRYPMLIHGDKRKPFVPLSRSMWAAEVDLAANLIDGSNPDLLYIGNNGLPYVLEKWKKVTLDGSFTYEPERFTGYVRVSAEKILVNNVVGNINLRVSKYDGTMLVTGPTNAPDRCSDGGGTRFYLTISNADSGWGDAYTPTADEIKAYFLGWRMFKFGDATNAPYNGDGQKDWGYRQIDGTLGDGGKTSVPTTQAPITLNWRPYKLQYLKANQTAESVINYETGLTLEQGWNMVEVGSGIVIREKSNFKLIGDYFQSNEFYYPETWFKHRPDTLLGIYKNNCPDYKHITWAGGSYGKIRPQFSKFNYDATAVYFVTYTMLDPVLSAPINISIAPNLTGTVKDIVQWAADAERRLSVVETQKAEKVAPQWIIPSLINGWTHDNPVGYYKDDVGVVRLLGSITGSNNSTIAFILPKGYRPDRALQLPAISWNGTTWIAASISIGLSGAVYVDHNGGTSKTVISSSFRAEQ
ncbi:hypothetical protein [Paenibacillus taiwanensis]|uniref:hypothetical protein n=1 Tax=Paenibacillus taiwanensis TaxID=401638 RepID=UPI00040E2A40|nr:hypothetical protein [Paenibacillus taiwanensis]